MPGSYQQACASKLKHKTYSQAKNQLHKRRDGDINGKKLAVYKCEYCGLWHVGNSSKLYRHPYKRIKYRLP